MRLSKVISKASLLAAIGPAASAPDSAGNSTYYNPVLPGWHSDPSCTQVDGTHAWSRESQLPGVSANTAGQQSGMYAATIRHRDGVFHVICEYLGAGYPSLGVIFTSADPFDERTWSDPVTFPAERIDPDLFWDDDGRAYVATQGVVLQEIDLATSALSQPPIRLWNGTGGASPEGPHLYRKDGARTRPYAHNPILTNRGTAEYFQTVGHGDLFQDAAGNWWGMCLTTRSGPAWAIYPMGREAVLFPVTWDAGEWAGAAARQGAPLSGWALSRGPRPRRGFLAAMPAGNPKAKLVIGTASAGLVSGGKWLLCGQSRGRLCHFAMEPGRGLLVPRAGMLISAAGDRYTGEAQYISATESIQF
ncbi:hypothetical protein F4824DRAFT_495367 [Ustulina deusta]|nr:hypothetical protein F4824DRAFT_495367 [Ustulina deusta]